MRGWLGAGRRLLLKSRYRMQRANARLRARLGHGDPALPLEHVQRRLELLLTAVYGRAIPIVPIENNMWTRERVRHLADRDPRAREPAPGFDGETIYLPVELASHTGDDAALTRYRLFALEQAERIVRGTANHASLADPLERDLYLLREGAAIDAHIARAHPGVAEALTRERQSALERRPKLENLTKAEQSVELLVRETLATRPDDVESPSSDPDASLDWARKTAERVRDASSKYRGLPASSIWGTVRTGATKLPTPTDVAKHSISTGNAESTHGVSSKGQQVEGAGKSANESPSTATLEEEPPEDGAGTAAQQVEEPRDSSSMSTGQAGTMTTVDVREIDPETLKTLPAATWYDEWSANTSAYVKRGAAVRLYPAEEGDDQWAPQTLQRHAAVVRQIRQQFERLRARRSLLSRQRAGDELDIAACVNAIVDRRIGASPDDRLYLDARPARRGLAISLLVDVSGSTEARVANQWRIVDLEKIALLLATQALDALGDLYAVYAFAGKTRSNVKVTTVKDFAERSGDAVHRRIAALEPGGFTRLGAAVRHATRQLARQSAGHRLLLLLSDGRPNDVDGYQGSYAVDDSRQAILEARGSGVFPFCLTIDREASEYLPRIFGMSGHTILQRPEQLPTALLRVVQGLIKR